jgi:hypothetical protein
MAQDRYTGLEVRADRCSFEAAVEHRKGSTARRPVDPLQGVVVTLHTE